MSKFNFNIDIEDNERQNSLSKFKYNSISLKKLYLDLYIVDLGLQSGTKWCKYNLGVNISLLDKAEDWYGDYYAWGEIKSKDYYAWETYKFGKISYIKKYNKKDNLKLLLLEDDAAYLNLHIGNLKFRIPSKELFEELLENTTTKWVENYNDIIGLNGRIFKSKTNYNELFIPAVGYYNNLGLCNVGIIDCLWSSNLVADIPSFAWYLNFDSKWTGIYYSTRISSMNVRPVLYTN